jgi:hypothetical protein
MISRDERMVVISIEPYVYSSTNEEASEIGGFCGETLGEAAEVTAEHLTEREKLELVEALRPGRADEPGPGLLVRMSSIGGAENAA